MSPLFFDDFAMVRFAIPPRFEIAFEGDPDPSFHVHFGMSQPGWYYRFTGRWPTEYLRPYDRETTFDPRWRHSVTPDRASTLAAARRDAKKRALVYSGPADVKIDTWGNVVLSGKAWGVFKWHAPILARLRAAAAQFERRKTWEALSPSTQVSFKLEILNRDEVAELVRSIAAEQE